jgi:S-formylglutathione hydrolase FrmB
MRHPRRGPVAVGAAVLAISIGASACSSGPKAPAGSGASATDPAGSQAIGSLPGTELTQSGDGSGDLRLVDFHSKALRRVDSYLIYLPPGYQSAASSGTRFPVLYVLHGDGNHGHRDALHLFERGKLGPRASELWASGRLRHMLIVVPNLAAPNPDGDTEWANTSRGPYESALLQMVHTVDATWSTIANRSGRAISGLSMGGYGAVNIGLRHLNLFSMIESWSGYFNQTRDGPYEGASRKLLRATSPAVYVRRMRRALARNPIHVLLYVSPADAFASEQAPFARTLRSLGVSVVAKLFGGRHNFDLWAAHMELGLTFASRWLAPPGSA